MKKLELETRFGMMKGLNFNINIRSQKQLWMGLYERELHGWFDRFSKGARTVIDGGGGYGYYSSYFLVKTEVEKVFCFEPISEQREEMRRTWALQELGWECARASSGYKSRPPRWK